MKILHIAHWPNSGITRMIEQIIMQTNISNYHNYVLMLNKNIVFDDKIATICCHNASIGNHCTYYEYYSELKSYINRIQPDIVHTHSFSPALYTGHFVSRSRHLTTIHNDYPYLNECKLSSYLKRKILELAIIPKVTYVTCVSNAIKNKVTQMCRRDASKIITIYNGITIGDETAKAGVLELKKEIDADDDTIIITSVGRLHKQKGYHILLKAIAVVINVLKEKKIKLIIVGEGDERVSLEKIVRAYNLCGCVYLVGHKTDPSRYLSISDIYVSSSSYEGFGLSIAEAMSFRLPVIATSVGGVVEIIQDDVDGFLVEPNNVYSLSTKIIDTINNLKDIKHIGINAKHKISTKFSIQSSVSSYQQLYESMVN